MEKYNTAFAFLPRKSSVADIVAYVEELAPSFPKAKMMVATGERPGEDFGLFHKNEKFSVIHTTRERLDLVAGGYCLMETAVRLKIDWLFFNLGTMRYDVNTFAAFVSQAWDFKNTACMVFGVPPLLTPNSQLEEQVAIQDPKVRWRLLVDLFINYTLSVALDRPFMNMNAGVLGVSRKAMEYLLSIPSARRDDDSSLLCPQMLWHLIRSQSAFEIKQIPVSSIRLEGLGFNMQKAVREVVFVLNERGRVGKSMTPRQMADDFFSVREYWNRWVTPTDQEKFYLELIPKVEKLFFK